MSDVRRPPPCPHISFVSELRLNPTIMPDISAEDPHPGQPSTASIMQFTVCQSAEINAAFTAARNYTEIIYSLLFTTDSN